MKKRGRPKRKINNHQKSNKYDPGNYKFYDPRFTPTSEYDIFDSSKTQHSYNNHNKAQNNYHNQNINSNQNNNGYSNYDGYNKDYNNFSPHNKRNMRGRNYNKRGVDFVDLAVRGLRQVTKEGLFVLKDIIFNKRR